MEVILEGIAHIRARLPRREVGGSGGSYEGHGMVVTARPVVLSPVANL